MPPLVSTGFLWLALWRLISLLALTDRSVLSLAAQKGLQAPLIHLFHSVTVFVTQDISSFYNTRILTQAAPGKQTVSSFSYNKAIREDKERDTEKRILKDAFDNHSQWNMYRTQEINKKQLRYSGRQTRTKECPLQTCFLWTSPGTNRIKALILHLLNPLWCILRNALQFSIFWHAKLNRKKLILVVTNESKINDCTKTVKSDNPFIYCFEVNISLSAANPYLWDYTFAQ